MPWARPAAIAEASVQPVPWVERVAMRGASRTKLTLPSTTRSLTHRAGKMAALQHHRRRAEREQPLGRTPHVVERGDREAGQQLGLRHVGREHARARDEAPLQRLDRARIEQTRAARGDHHRIDAPAARSAPRPRAPSATASMTRRSTQHAGLDAIGADIVEHRVDLPPHEIGRDREDARGRRRCSARSAR